MLFRSVLWNSSGYEGEETLEILSHFVDVYLPDLKTLDKDFSSRFFNALDYPDQTAAAILKMIKQKELRFNGEVMVQGVMIRHLVIPGFLESTRKVLSWFKNNVSKGTALLSLMTQYTPVNNSEKETPGRYVSSEEYDAVISMLEEFGIDDGFCQELVTGSDWLPDFTKQNPFSSELSEPVWFWRQ